MDPINPAFNPQRSLSANTAAPGVSLPYPDVPALGGGPAPAPTAAPTGAVTPAVMPTAQPTQPGVQPAPAALPQDQVSLTPAAQGRDPQMLAALSVYSLQLSSSNPVDVSSAINVLENMGPAYRQDAINAVKQHLTGGMNPMAATVMIDALQRWGAKDALPQIQNLMSDPNPDVRGVAAKAWGQMSGALAPQPAAPAAAPGTPGAATTAGATPAAPAPTNVPAAFVQSYVDRLRDPLAAPGVCLEIANLPTNQVSAIVQAAAADTSISRPETFELLTQILVKHVQEPTALDGLRAILNRPSPGTYPAMDRAKGRAALAVLNFGTPADMQGYLRFLAGQPYMDPALRKLLIESLGNKPQVLADPAVISTLGAIMSDPHGFDSAIAAAHMLGLTKSAAARDLLGTSQLLTAAWVPAYQKVWVLGYLAMQPPPYNAETKEILTGLAQNKDKDLAAKAKELLKKAG